MKMNKRKTSLLLSIVSLLTLFSCNNNKNSSPIPNTSNTDVTNNDSEKPIEKVDKSDYPYINSLDSYKKTDWVGKWIWADKSVSNSYVAFRKKINLTSKPRSAIASISAESKYTLWVNSQLVVVDGSPKRGATYYDSYYEDVNLTSYLNIGDNVIVALVCYNGRGGNSSVDPGHGGFLLDLNIDGKIIGTDSSFKVKRLKEYKNKSLLAADWPGYKQASMLAEWNVYYDANDSVGKYYEKDYDDSSWDNATIVCNATKKPFNDLYKSVTPLISFDKEYTYLSNDMLGKKLTENTTLEFTLPENMQFSAYFDIDSETDNLRFTYYTDTYTSQGMNSFKDDYITIKGKQEYENYPWRTGTKLIIEAEKGITFNKVGIRRSQFDSKQVGSFKCENENLNKLWKKASNTLKICMRDTFMDCPERERSPYIGDSANQIGETFYALDTNSYSLIKKTILSIVGWTKNNNEIPLRSPSSSLNENPGQTLNFINSVYEYLLYTGDSETVKLFYPIALNYLKLWNLLDDGSVLYRSGSFVWTDWGSSQDDTVTQNAFYYYGLTAMKNIASILDIKTDDNFYSERLSKIKDGFKKFSKAGGYSSSNKYDDRANAMAVVSGLAEESQYSNIINVLKSVENASPYMERFVLEALCMLNQKDYAIERMLKRYDKMIKDDSCSTLWELWNKNEGTINHGWTGGPLTVLSKNYAGVKPTKVGYSEYEIVVDNTLSSIESITDTLKGQISYKLSKQGSSYLIELSTIDSIGYVKIPKSISENITVDKDVEKTTDENYTNIKVLNGSYKITLN